MHTGERHFIRWPTEAVENQAAEIHRLRDIIDRTQAALADSPGLQLALDLGRLGASSVQAFDITHRAALVLEAVRSACDILAEGKGAGRG